jgi:hypothetical protein
VATLDLTQERIAKNQSTFREANEKIEAAADSLGLDGRLPFICECAQPSCHDLVHLTLVEYEHVRADATRFFNAVGHEALSVDAGAAVVVERHEGYVVSEKIGVAADVAADADSRGHP